MPSISSSNVNLQWRSETEIDDHLCPAFHISSHLNLIPSHLSMINFTRPTSAEDPLGISVSCMRDWVSYCASEAIISAIPSAEVPMAHAESRAAKRWKCEDED